MIGRVRPAVESLAGYRPGKAAGQVESEHGITNAIKLASNENPWPPIAPIANAIAAAVAGVNRYAANQAADVCAAIAAWQDVSVDRITTGCGSSGLLQQIFMTYASAGDDVVFPWPSFEIYPVFSKIFDANAVTVPLGDGFKTDLDAVADAVTPNTSLVFLATPNNPTGTSISTTDLRAALERIPSDVIVVIDEAYREFNDPAFGDPVHDLQPDFDNVVVTRTFSKAFGLAGLRSGYCIAHPDVIMQINKVKLPFSVNNLAQAGMLAAIEHEAEALENVGALLVERQRCVDALRNAGLNVPDTQANFVLIPTGEETLDHANTLEAKGIVTRPFPDLGLRITIGTPEQNDRWLSAVLTLIS